MKIVFASGNAHKLREVTELLEASMSVPFELLSLKDIGFDGDIVEDGSTFEENSMIKAKTVYDFCHLPVIADDSGICVDALGGAPGIHSARYAQVFADKNSPDDTNTELLLKNMAGKTDRKAQFICAVSFVSETLSFTVRGECHGEVINEKRGDGGFGYDPVFYMKEFQKTLSEVTEEEKNSVSHRGKAIRAAAEKISRAFEK